jgi:hypothetical protein
MLMEDPNVTEIKPLADGCFDLAMTFSARQVPEEVLGDQTYENVSSGTS